MNAVISAFTALFVCGAVFTRLPGKTSFQDKTVFSSVSDWKYAALFLTVFAALFVSSVFIDADRIRRAALMFSYATYAAVCMTLTDDAFFCLGACVILLPISVFACHGSPKGKDMNKYALVAVCAAAGIYFTVLFSLQTVCRYLSLSTPCFDFGIFSQMFYNMKKTGIPYTSCEREGILSHFAVHVSPVYYLFLPFYCIFPSPLTLQICQAVTLASGVIPACLLCRRVGLSRKATAVFVLLYALYPALGGGTYYDVHENKFLAPLLLWMFYFLESDKILPSAVFAASVCLVKEDAPVYVVFAGIYYLIAKKSRRQRIAAVCFSVFAAVYFLGVTYCLARFGDGVMNYRYSNFMAEGQSSLFSVVANVFKAPAYAVYEIFSVDGAKPDVSKLEFMLQTVVPLGALPFLIKNYDRLILLCPFVLVNLMPDYVYQHDIFFQYTYGAFPFLFLAAVLNYRDLRPETKRTVAVFALVSSVLFCTQTVWRRATYLNTYLEGKNGYDEVRQTLESIPEDASVSATSFFCAALSGRSELYSLNNSKNEHRTDYICIDMRWRAYSKYFDKYKDDAEYVKVYEREGLAVILKKTEKAE